ncbi:MAG: serine/threonine protein kinase [Acidobacteria bacterium]|nr:serine/threonine protein kinase [Acidobacteriota bacterium]
MFEIDAKAWTTLNDLLDRALDLPATERARWIDSLSSEYEPLKPRLRELLAKTAGDLTMPKIAAMSRDWRAGEVVGTFRLLRQIGEGGMGTVWLAEPSDGRLNRTVALKLPRDFAGVGERMAAERDMLAALNHPNIARLYEAGVTSDGHPFLALEYVDGVAINRYCAEKQLGDEDRVRLVSTVARAVAHAHARLIVHRDLKPSNILVNAEGETRLLDFGIAKLMHAGGEATEEKSRALTLLYSAPEQIVGEPVTVAADVYSLGVVLHELLTGKRPFAEYETDRTAFEAAVLHRAPVSGKTDLDLILQKALDRRPERRYATMNAFAADLDRYLNGFPIEARAPNWRYRLSKLARRNPIATAAAAIALTAVLLGSAAVWWQYRVALAEKARAEDVKEFLTQIFQRANIYASGSRTLTATELLIQTDTRLDQSLDSRPELRAELRSILAASLGTLQDNESALRVASKAAREAAVKLGESHHWTLQARSLELGMRRFGAPDEALNAEMDKLLAAMRACKDLDPAYLIHALETKSSLLTALGKNAESEAVTTEALALARRHLRETDAQMTLLLVHISYVYQRALRFKEALDAAGQAYRITFDVLHQDPKHPSALDTRMSYGMALGDMNRWGEALPLLRGATRDAEAVYGRKARTVAFYWSHLARYALRAGELREGAEAYAHSAELFAADAGAVLAHVSMIENQAAAHLTACEGEKASALMEEVVKRRMQYAGRVPVSTRASAGFARALRGELTALDELTAEVIARKDPALRPVLYMHGIALRLAGKHEEAIARQRAALHTAGSSERERVQCEFEIGMNEVEMGRFDSAAASLEKARSYYEQNVPKLVPPHADALCGLARVAAHRGDARKARSLAARCDEYWREFAPGSRWAASAARTREAVEKK